jgi:acyl carrier protein
VPGADCVSPPDEFERDIIERIKTLSRRPVQPTLNSELLADLGFDSLQVLELVGELEERFDIAIPLNDLTHVKTVAHVIDRVRGLVQEGPSGSIAHAGSAGGQPE